MPNAIAPIGTGRPAFKVTPLILEQLEQAGEAGLTEAQAASLIGIHPSTYILKKKIYPELDAAYERGRIKGVLDVAGALKRNAMEMALDAKGNEVGTPGGSVEAQKFFLSRRGGEAWRDNPTTVINNNVVIPLFEQRESKLIEAMNDDPSRDEGPQTQRSLGAGDVDESGGVARGTDTPTDEGGGTE